MVEKVVPAAHEDPVKGWELLRAPALASHPDRFRLLCRVCWIALDRGMAEQVTHSWGLKHLDYRLDPRCGV